MNESLFRDPPNEYREVPFWSWNDELDPLELLRQIGLMDEAGCGGFFMHARVGLRTPYMGREWLDCVRACVDEASRRGMAAWLYDEDKWPSGFAGGLSVAAHPEFRAQYLICKVDNRPALLAERIATFAARQAGGQLVDIRPDDAPVFESSADRLIQFYPQTMPVGTPWFNDYAYLSVLKADAVRAFLDATHEVYARTVGHAFGTTVPGIFSDEPCSMYSDPRGMRQTALPWTDDMPAHFRARNGYDLLPHLPSLFFEVGDFQAVRYDFWRTVTERYVASYTRQVYDWCDAHHLCMTGHEMHEDTLQAQVRWIGAAMPHYPYMHVPGVDKLDRSINTGAGTVLTIKQLDSVVCQLGKPRALCENYGCGGQDFAHAGRKWIGDWAYVLGVNLNNPHLALYSLRGERKRDYPQIIFYQQPWWPENRLVADYFARLSWMLSQGQRVVDILVVHPIGSAWALFNPMASYAVDRLDRELDRLLMALMKSQRDFHLGDEMLMEPGGATAARVVHEAEGARLALGLMAYRVVIVPPGVTLVQNTVRLLREFVQAGGIVLALEPLPVRVDGRATGGEVLPAATRLVTVETLSGVLDEVLPFDVRAPGCPWIWSHHRRIGASDCYFLANIDLARGRVAAVQLRGTGRVEAWDAATGEVRPLPSRESGGISEVVLDFAPAGSHLLVMHRDQVPSPALVLERSAGASVDVRPGPERVIAEIPLDDEWDLALGSANSITLDTPQLSIDGGSWSRPMHILDAHAEAARAGAGSSFALRFTFDADERPAGLVHLVVESPEQFAITVNRQPVPAADAGWWVDTAFRKVDIREAVAAGRNTIELSGLFTRDTELESVYVIGDFGVAGRRLREEGRLNGQVFDRYASDWRITSLPRVVRTKTDGGRQMLDLTSQGLPFFAGRATLRQTLSLAQLPGRAALELHGLRAAVARVRVNEQEMGVVAWQPHRIDVTAGLCCGENLIEIELVGTLRNLLGPHHLKDGDLERTGPAQFRDKGRWTDDTILVPFGFAGVTFRATD